MNENVRMRVASGEIDDDRRVVAFLYLLMRDHLTPGVVETIIDEVTTNRMARFSVEGGHILFTNGWLARHAQDVADRLGIRQVTT